MLTCLETSEKINLEATLEVAGDVGGGDVKQISPPVAADRESKLRVMVDSGLTSTIHTRTDDAGPIYRFLAFCVWSVW